MLSRLLPILIAFFVVATAFAATRPQITRDQDIVALSNSEVRFEFNLATGTYRILGHGGKHPVITGASLKINEWSTSDPAFRRFHDVRIADGPLGSETALELHCTAEGKPDLLFSIALHDGNFFSLGGGIINTTGQSIRVRDIHVMVDGVIHEGTDLTENFAMIDGFSGGEPLEYGARSYSPLTRRRIPDRSPWRRLAHLTLPPIPLRRIGHLSR